MHQQRPLLSALAWPMQGTNQSFLYSLFLACLCLVILIFGQAIHHSVLLNQVAMMCAAALRLEAKLMTDLQAQLDARRHRVFPVPKNCAIMLAFGFAQRQK
jgi:hypothetical protein